MAASAIACSLCNESAPNLFHEGRDDHAFHLGCLLKNIIERGDHTCPCCPEIFPSVFTQLWGSGPVYQQQVVALVTRVTLLEQINAKRCAGDESQEQAGEEILNLSELAARLERSLNPASK